MNIDFKLNNPFFTFILYPLLGTLAVAGVLDYATLIPGIGQVVEANFRDFLINGVLLIAITILAYRMCCIRKHRDYLDETRPKTPEIERLWDKVTSSLDDLAREQAVKDAYITNLLTLADHASGISMWVKDANDRYVFADQTLRSSLLEGRSLPEVVGKSDAELFDAPECNMEDLSEIMDLSCIEKLPELDPTVFRDSRVCNITDVITRRIGEPCRFHEEINDKLYDVWKTPVFKEGEISGTVGCLVDVTHIKEKRLQDVERLRDAGEAYRIDSTPNYFIKRYQFGELDEFQRRFLDAEC